jgi:hypothetical protein
MFIEKINGGYKSLNSLECLLKQYGALAGLIFVEFFSDVTSYSNCNIISGTIIK